MQMGFAAGCDPSKIGLSWASFPVVSRTSCAQPPAISLASLRLAKMKEVARIYLPLPGTEVPGYCEAFLWDAI